MYIVMKNWSLSTVNNTNHKIRLSKKETILDEKRE